MAKYIKTGIIICSIFMLLCCNPFDLFDLFSLLFGKKEEGKSLSPKQSSNNDNQALSQKQSFPNQGNQLPQQMGDSNPPSLQHDISKLPWELSELTKAGKKIAQVVPWEKLKSGLPSEIAGWEKEGDLEGGTVNYMGISVSHVKQRYKSGDKKLSIKITDTTFSPMIAAPIRLHKNFSIVTPTQIQNSVEIQGHPGFISINKKTAHNTLLLLVAERFLIEIEVNGQISQDELKELAAKVNLSYLVSIVNHGVSN